MNFSEASQAITGQIGTVLSRVSAEEVEAVCDRLAGATAVFVTGEGRSGLVGRCFAMRLTHLGLRVHFVGDSTAPALRPGEVLVAVSGTGGTAVTQTVARLARQVGGQVIAVTADRGSPLASLAGLTLVVPADLDDITQYGRSLFEQCALIALDVIAQQLQLSLGQTREQMDVRHANLE